MRIFASGLAVVLPLVAVACVDRTPPPPDARIPQGRVDDPDKPMPRPGEDYDDDARSLPPPPFNDEPLVTQGVPEEAAFLDAYNAVGRPRMLVFVSHALDAAPPPAANDDSRQPAGRADDQRDRDIFTPDERDDVYLRPDQYDPDAAARQIDYQAVEEMFTSCLAAGGRTDIVSPIAARQRLTAEQVKDLETGRPGSLDGIAERLGADVLIYITARPTRQSQAGLDLRLAAEAVNLGKDGQSIGRGFVDVRAPMDRSKLERFARFLARIVMDRMTGTWENLPRADDSDDRGPLLRDRDLPRGDEKPAPGGPATEPAPPR